MERFFARWAASALGLFVAAQLPGTFAIHFREGVSSYLPNNQHLPVWAVILAAALILALVNTFVRPLVVVFTCLINFLTLGLFTLVVNVAMIFVTSWIMDRFLDAGFISLGPQGVLAALAAAIIVGIVNFIFNKIF
ncbi:MAG: phage holin family protein [Dehalococcoidia bacterium]|nr:phage holin family protein [Dehalococcoidia bacterium]